MIGFDLERIIIYTNFAWDETAEIQIDVFDECHG